MYNPIDIAYFFLKKYGDKDAITPMKLVKLVYIAHGWHLGLTGRALIDENPEAWQYGPVIPTVYHRFKSYGGSRITETSFSPDPEELISPEIQQFLEKIWSVYGKFDAIQLSAKTHEINTPWYITWQNKQNRKGNFGIYSSQIPDNLIKEYYENKFHTNKVKSNT